MAPNIPDVRYEACWTEDDGLYSCGCGHGSIQEAMACVEPDGRTFIRAVRDGDTRPLNEAERVEFLAASNIRFRDRSRLTTEGTEEHGGMAAPLGRPRQA